MCSYLRLGITLAGCQECFPKWRLGRRSLQGDPFRIPTTGKVCKLLKALYGLKQSPKSWFERFSKAITTLSFHHSNVDHTMFLKNKRGKATVLIVYVDDTVVTENNLDKVERLKAYLRIEFEIKDLGKLKYFLGIKVARSNKGIFLSQRKYVLDLLKET